MGDLGTAGYAIETIELTKRYGHIVAVSRLNLQVAYNTIHGFLGPNGAGKTTTMKILVGLLRPDGGSVRVLGEEVDGDRPDVRRRLGYMPELPRFPKHLKGRELLDLYGRMYGMSEQARREQIPRLLELVGLKERSEDLIGKYSKGMQQRIGIAQALLNEPELVILDEPSLGLDPVGMVEVRGLVKSIFREGVSVFISSHLLHEVQQMCSHVTIIHKGVALASDTLSNVTARLSGPRTIEAEVEDLTDVVVARIRQLPFVVDVMQEENRLKVQVKAGGDVRAQVSRAITSAGGTIVALKLVGQGLEEAFLQVIGEAPEAAK